MTRIEDTTPTAAANKLGALSSIRVYHLLYIAGLLQAESNEITPTAAAAAANKFGHYCLRGSTTAVLPVCSRHREQQQQQQQQRFERGTTISGRYVPWQALPSTPPSLTLLGLQSRFGDNWGQLNGIWRGCPQNGTGVLKGLSLYLHQTHAVALCARASSALSIPWTRFHLKINDCLPYPWSVSDGKRATIAGDHSK